MTASNSGVKDFEGKVAVVTGGSRGIGKAIVDELIEKGAKVVIGDILESLGREITDAYNEKAGVKVAAFIYTDVSKYSDNKALFQFAETEFGGVDIAILNAGTVKNFNTFFSPMDDALEEGIFNVNSVGVIKGSKVALMHMGKRGGGSIVCTASTAGLYTLPDTNAYNASKHAVIGYVRSCSIMPAVCNVRVNAVCPTWVATDLLEGFTTSTIDDPFVESMKASPFAKMSDVVNGVFTFLYDESRNAETLMILSDGPKLNVPAPFPDQKCVNVRKIYLENIIPHAKKQFSEALERYYAEQ